MVEILEYERVITNYMNKNKTADVIHTDNFSIYLEQLSLTCVVRKVKNQPYVYLGYESVCKLRKLFKIVPF